MSNLVTHLTSNAIRAKIEDNDDRINNEKLILQIADFKMFDEN